MSWVPLHVHSQYSILDATAPIGALAERAKALGMPSLALTDQGNLHGAVEFYKACKKQGVHPIIGSELYVAPTLCTEKKKLPGQKAGYPIVLLAKDASGYRNLCKLSSIAHLEGFYYTPRIDKELLKKHSAGLVCLSGPMRGKVAELIALEDEATLIEEINWYQDCFGTDYYLEMTRHLMSEEQMRADGMDREGWLMQATLEYQKKQEKVNARLGALSKECGIPLVATNDSRYMERDDWQAHEILLNISSGEPVEIWERDSKGNLKNRALNPKRRLYLTHELYFKTPEQMQELFKETPQALSETLKVAEKCQFEIDFDSKFYPVFVPPALENKDFNEAERKKAAEKFLKSLCEEGIARRYSEDALARVAEKYPGKNPLEIVKERLAYELKLIISKGLGDYLLIVYDFINWAKRRGIPMGPGRGSGAGSIICYLTEITDIEPLRFNLLFERFINPERMSYPDIDVDICMQRRGEVIDYTVEKYGHEKVAQIITFGTMKAKMALKDVGRVLNIPLSKVNELAKLVPEELNMTLDRALELDPELRSRYENDEEIHRLVDLAKKLEGSVRNTGIHAAGLIVCADSLVEHIPVCTSKDAHFMVTQFAMKPVESVGMLKIDFLGLKTLTSIQHTVDAIAEKDGKVIDWVNLPLDNQATFNLLNHGKTLGIFQLESGGMQELARQLHIDKFEEIIAVGALYRPGPMEMIPSFIKRKHGKEEIEIDHPEMEDILKETYGIMVYQEQVMQIAERLAGYSLAAGDVLRRAMGKKDRQEMARQRKKFRKGALDRGVDETTSKRIFDKIEKFASYGFNKSHAAAYGYLSYVTGYLKANYPMDWMAALMTSDRDDLSKVTKIIRECQAMEIAILPPDVNESAAAFVATSKGIRFALTAIKGVGEGVCKAITCERRANGPFSSLYDFTCRVPSQKVGKKVIEYLVEVGAFDFTGWERDQLLISVDPMYESAVKEQKDAARGEMSLFSLMEEEKNPFETPPIVEESISKEKLLLREKELLGFYLTGHPLEKYQPLMQRLSCVNLSELSEKKEAGVIRAAFVVETVRFKITSRSSRKFAILTISDGAGCFELPIWPDLYDEKPHLLAENQLLYAILEVSPEEAEVKLQCRWFDDLKEVNEGIIKDCDVAFDRAWGALKLGKMRNKGPQRRKKEEQVPPERLHLTLDARKVRLSHLLELKKLFRSHPGKSPLHLGFNLDESFLGEVRIDASWGVELSDHLKQKLHSHPAVLKNWTEKNSP